MLGWWGVVGRGVSETAVQFSGSGAVTEVLTASTAGLDKPLK